MCVMAKWNKSCPTLPQTLLPLLLLMPYMLYTACLFQVCAMRMPVDMLLVWLPQMLEGTLIWADDSKNKFRLKV